LICVAGGERILSPSVYDDIKQRIILLEIQPGSAVHTKSLADELGVSVTPVREALIRLEADGLIRRVPNGTAQVAEVHLHDLKDLLEARLLLVEQIARLAAQRVSAEELAEMRQIVEQMKTESERRTLIQLDSQFHRLINDATRNRTLSQLEDLMRNHVLRLWYYVSNDDEYWRDLVEDRNRLIDALGSRDVGAATEILKSHVTRFVEVVRASTWS